MKLQDIVEQQKSFFNSGNTKSISYRRGTLKRLYSEIKHREKDIAYALKLDLNKSYEESYMTEIAIVLDEIKTLEKNLTKWGKKKRKKTPLTHFPSRSYIYREPFGNVLILAPWNYPFHLAMLPLAGAIAGGNTVVVKPSRNSVNTGAIIREIIDAVFYEDYVYCVDEDITYDEILSCKYDKIFFTGSPKVGRTVMKAASKNLTPVVLELGGKSPCVVDRTANLKIAAKRIAWGKFLNGGQTCVAPDYLLVDVAIKEEFLDILKSTIKDMYGDALKNKDYVHIINKNRFDTLKNLIENAGDVWGGRYDEDTLCIEPTIIENASWDDEIMEEEIFGPILPVIDFEDVKDMTRKIQEGPRPLAFYIFCKDREVIEYMIKHISFGGGCVNDVVMHVANGKLPFGGVGNSGMGMYHGKYSWETFTRPKAVEKNKNILDMPFRYPPYTEKKFKFIRKIF